MDSGERVLRNVVLVLYVLAFGYIIIPALIKIWGMR
jgi:hypothetical protein